MKDTIRHPGHEVSVVIYDSPLPPRYFRFTKRFIKTFFVLVPVLFGLLGLGLFFWGFASRIKEVPVPQMPAMVSTSEQKIASLEEEIRILQKSNSELQEKIASPIDGQADDPFLMLIRKPYGMQNLLGQNRVTLDQIEFVQDPQKVTLKFQVINPTPENRVTGHVLVFMLSEAGLLAWPKEAQRTMPQGVKFSSGDPFAVSRLRPTEAVFPNTGKDMKFFIYIFNREGDLLLVKETADFKAGTK